MDCLGDLKAEGMAFIRQSAVLVSSCGRVLEKVCSMAHFWLRVVYWSPVLFSTSASAFLIETSSCVHLDICILHGLSIRIECIDFGPAMTTSFKLHYFCEGTISK